ncbi:MAG: PrsW family intramembrane metalloprotease [Halobacteriales archaeon]
MGSPRGERLEDVVRWEPEHVLDGLAVWIYGAIRTAFRWVLILAGVGILGFITAVTGLSAVGDPVVFAIVILSIVPALALAGFVWRADVGAEEPPTLLAVTFVLGVIFAAFAGLLNALGAQLVGAVPVVSSVVFLYLVVGPVEEGVKLLAVRLHAFRHRRFDAVVDGAVYGAVAGLGFATIENALYITDALEGLARPVVTDALGEAATVRALVGPGHVIYSGIAGYYLGLAKFNPRHAGPLVVKGLLVAAALHATYNLTVGVVPALLVAVVGLSAIEALLAFILVYDGLAGYYLYRKLSRYRRAYRASRGEGPGGDGPHLTEFDPS